MSDIAGEGGGGGMMKGRRSGREEGYISRRGLGDLETYTAGASSLLCAGDGSRVDWIQAREFIDIRFSFPSPSGFSTLSGPSLPNNPSNLSPFPLSLSLSLCYSHSSLARPLSLPFPPTQPPADTRANAKRQLANATPVTGVIRSHGSHFVTPGEIEIPCGSLTVIIPRKIYNIYPI